MSGAAAGAGISGYSAANVRRSPGSFFTLYRKRFSPIYRYLKSPRIAASTPTERTALGYLHGNCGHCHNDNGSPAPVGLLLAQRAQDADAGLQRVLASLVAADGRYRAPGSAATLLVDPGHPEHSLLSLRLRSRQPQAQMPPLGTRVIDAEGLALVERWIANDLTSQPQPQPQPH